MPLSLDQQTWLEELLDRATSEGNLSEWESKFVADQVDRYEKYGAEMLISPKQKAILDRIEEKLTNGGA